MDEHGLNMDENGCFKAQTFCTAWHVPIVLLHVGLHSRNQFITNLSTQWRSEVTENLVIPQSSFTRRSRWTLNDHWITILLRVCFSSKASLTSLPFRSLSKRILFEALPVDICWHGVIPCQCSRCCPPRVRSTVHVGQCGMASGTSAASSNVCAPGVACATRPTDFQLISNGFLRGNMCGHWGPWWSMGNQKFVTTPAHSKAARRPTASANPLCTAATSFLANLANSQYVHTVSHAHTHTIHGYTAIPTLDHKLYEGASRSCDVVLGFFLHGCVCVCAVLWRCMAAHPIADIAGGRMPIFCDVFLAGWLP